MMSLTSVTSVKGAGIPFPESNSRFFCFKSMLPLAVITLCSKTSANSLLVIPFKTPFKLFFKIYASYMKALNKICLIVIFKHTKCIGRKNLRPHDKIFSISDSNLRPTARMSPDCCRLFLALKKKTKRLTHLT